jgi:hypothetical protein
MLAVKARRTARRPKKGRAAKGRKTGRGSGMVDPSHSTKREATKEVNQVISGTTLRLLKSPISDNLLINFRWVSPVSFVTNAAAYAGIQVHMNDLHTADGTNAMQLAYANEWATFFGEYRVIETHYKVTLVNVAPNPVNFVCISLPYLNSIGNNYTGTPFLWGEPYSQQALVSQTSGLDRHTFTGKINHSEMIGSEEYYKDDNYAALFPSASPSRLNYFYYGAWIDGTIVTEFNVELEFQLTAHLYNRLQNTSLQTRIDKKRSLRATIPIVSPKKVIIEPSSTTTTTTSSTDCDCDESFMDYTEY